VSEAAAERLPPVRSAHGLYTALLRLGKPQSGQRKVQPDATAALVDWLDSDHREPARRLLESGERIAQETVGLTWQAGGRDVGVQDYQAHGMLARREA